ncbi:hypothetical protein ACHAW5_010708 [Stephanodiscus triporus]|uniref:Lon N-terminal domain-containing protein n=1 Tax=Stephanodiscus triporus TaxID=2934178 RepID=A0ABD3MEP0_9STRA
MMLMFVATALVTMVAPPSLSFRSSIFVQSFSARPRPNIIARKIIETDGTIRDALLTRNSPSCYSSTCLRMSSTPFNYGQQQTARRNIRLPLLVDISKDDGQLQYDVPLPNDHLPPELTTASLFELKLDIPLHRSVIQDAISSTKLSDSCSYGHVVYKPDNSDGLVGCVGCASDILIGATSAAQNAEERSLARGREDSGPLLVLARGSYRFRVKEIVKSIPYPVAIVDEILDEKKNRDDSDTDEDDDDALNTLSSKDLVKQIFQSLGKLLRAQAEAAAAPLSPLEKSILEDAPSSTPMAQAIQRRFDAEERIAVFQIFTSSLLDLAPDERDRIFAVGMMAGELANLPSDARVKMLVMTDGVARLRLVLRELSKLLSMDSARKITKSLSLGGGGNGDSIKIDPRSLKEAEESQKQLQVGTPKLPKWADQIKKGIRVEYFWNEDEGWCLGTVNEDPIKIMDEIIVTVKFDDDGSIHKLPFRGDDKARWRPPMGNTGTFD